MTASQQLQQSNNDSPFQLDRACIATAASAPVPCLTVRLLMHMYTVCMSRPRRTGRQFTRTARPGKYGPASTGDAQISLEATPKGPGRWASRHPGTMGESRGNTARTGPDTAHRKWIPGRSRGQRAGPPQAGSPSGHPAQSAPHTRPHAMGCMASFMARNRAVQLEAVC